MIATFRKKAFAWPVAALVLTLLVGCAVLPSEEDPAGRTYEDPGIKLTSLDPAGLDIPEDELWTEGGDVTHAWVVREDLVLVRQTRYIDYVYHLFDRRTKEMWFIVSPVEHAQPREVTADGKLIFVGKNDGDCGNFQFPHLLVHDLDNRALRYQELYLARDVVFGMCNWQYALEDLSADQGKVVLDLGLLEGQMLAGGARWPFAIVDYGDDQISLRIFTITSEALERTLTGHPYVEKVKCRPLPEDTPVENTALLTEDFPYGHCVPEDALDGFVQSLKGPSVLLELKLRRKAGFRVDVVGETDLTYTISFE